MHLKLFHKKVLRHSYLVAIMKCYQCIVVLLLLCQQARQNRTTNIYLLTLIPYPNPDPELNPSWDDGDNIRPALELAKDQINNSSSLLQNYTLQLVHADGGCQIATTTAVGFVREVFHPDYRNRVITGIIGPGCSFATTVLGNLTNRTELSLVHVHGAGSPTLANRTLYQYVLGVLGSTNNYVEGFLYFMQRAGWEKVAVLYDNSRLYFLNTNRLLLTKTNATFLSPVSSTFIPLTAIRDEKLRVIFVLCPLELTRQIVCLAYENRMIYENYQWVIIDQLREELIQPIEFVYDRETYNCSMENMLTALNKALLMSYKLTPSNDSVIVSNTTHEEYLMYYTQYREAYNTEPLRHSDQKSSVYTHWATYLYDAVWAWALVLDNLTKCDDSFDIGSKYGNKKQADVIVEQFYQTRFNGMSGEIAFDRNTGFIERAVNLFQVENNDSVQLAVVKTGKVSTIMDPMQWNSDTFPITKVNRNLAIFFAVLVLIQFFIIVIFHILTVVYHTHKRPSIKASSPKLLHISYIGTYTIAVGIFLWAFNSAAELDTRFRPYFCQILWAWCLPIGFVLTFAPVAVRTWRIYRIFEHYLNPGPLISDPVLIGGVLLFLLGIIAIAVTWTVIDPFVLHEVPNFNSSVVKVRNECRSKYHMYWYAILTTYLTSIVLPITVLLLLTRSIPNKSFTTATLRVLCCIISLLFYLGFPFYYFSVLHFFDPIYSFASLCIVINLMLVASIIFIFLPPLLPIFKNYCQKND